MARDFWIAEIRATDRVVEKLRVKHNLNVEDIRAVCVPRMYIRAGWHTHPEHGQRLLVEAADQHGRIRIVLTPLDVNEGTWQLRTAWRMM